MKKIAAISGPAMGHVGRLARACYALIDHTELSIDFIYPQRSVYAGKILDSRCKQLPQGDEGKSFLERSVTFSSHLRQCFENTDYDLIVHDANPLAWLSTMDFPECPRVHITNGFLTSARPEPTFQEIRFDQCYHQLNELRAALGLATLESVYELYEADKVLLADPAPIVNLLGEMPENYVQCGACSWSMKGPIPQELYALKNPILMSMGSTGTSVFDGLFLERIKQFVGSNAIVYAGSKQGDLNEEYGIQQCYRWLPLDEVLARCKAVITQGGSGSSYQALSAGCPVIVIPTHRNHKILGRLIQGLGLGICISDTENPVSSLEQFDFHILSQQAKYFAREICSEDGPNAIARQIVELL